MSFLLCVAVYMSIFEVFCYRAEELLGAFRWSPKTSDQPIAQVVQLTIFTARC